MADNRLSIARCRELLGTDYFRRAEIAALSDEQVMKIRDDLYEMAEIVADVYAEFEHTTGDMDPAYLLPENRLSAYMKLVGLADAWGDDGDIE
jgi:hypothetical protein